MMAKHVAGYDFPPRGNPDSDSYPALSGSLYPFKLTTEERHPIIRASILWNMDSQPLKVMVSFEEVNYFCVVCNGNRF